MTTITSDVVAKNADEFKSFATTAYDLTIPKNEIDFLVEIVNRLDYVEEFVYGMSRGLLYASFESSPGHSEILEQLTSIASIEELEVEDDVNSYTITIDNF
jgi:hypothetical protein